MVVSKIITGQWKEMCRAINCKDLKNQMIRLFAENCSLHLLQAEKMLNEEEASDRQLREQFKERWTRTPSEQLTTPIREEAGKYRTIINNAISADGVVKERYGKHKQCIELLSKSDVSTLCHMCPANPM